MCVSVCLGRTWGDGRERGRQWGDGGEGGDNGVMVERGKREVMVERGNNVMIGSRKR